MKFTLPMKSHYVTFFFIPSKCIHVSHSTVIFCSLSQLPKAKGHLTLTVYKDANFSRCLYSADNKLGLHVRTAYLGVAKIGSWSCLNTKCNRIVSNLTSLETSRQMWHFSKPQSQISRCRVHCVFMVLVGAWVCTYTCVCVCVCK